ncbi:hypothetical protein [Anabaena sp. CCY 0017]|uniref:hypothetical protein n=1 Tax=Anabaena sp. CCY 0017 TaxID=3103866 RepID=UPI0039C6201D
MPDEIRVSETTEELRSLLAFAHKSYLKYGRGILITGQLFKEFSDMPIAPTGKHRYLYGFQICLAVVANTDKPDIPAYLNYDPSKQFMQCESDPKNYKLTLVTVLAVKD